MRDILFRGKRKGNGEWAEGDLIHLPNGISILANGYAYVIPETVGQYTGLTDKNGKRIFDGDICTYDEAIGVVEFCEDNAMFTFTYDENIETNFGCMWSTDLEVIGNIHDNPELLKGECENDR